jgi:hypothetical protein
MAAVIIPNFLPQTRLLPALVPTLPGLYRGCSPLLSLDHASERDASLHKRWPATIASDARP